MSDDGYDEPKHVGHRCLSLSVVFKGVPHLYFNYGKHNRINSTKIVHVLLIFSFERIKILDRISASTTRTETDINIYIHTHTQTRVGILILATPR